MSTISLFVEDDVDTLNMYEKIVGKNGLYAKNLQEAYLLYETYKPEVVIADFNIKGESPLDFIKYITQDKPDTRIYIITGYPILAPLKYFDFNTDHLIMKPVKIDFIKRITGTSKAVFNVNT